MAISTQDRGIDDEVPERIMVVAAVDILGEERDPVTKQKLVVEAGTEFEMDRRLAERLARSPTHRVAISKRAREAAKKTAAARKDRRERRAAERAGQGAMSDLVVKRLLESVEDLQAAVFGDGVPDGGSDDSPPKKAAAKKGAAQKD